MSKLTQVRKALQENRSITIVSAQEENNLLERNACWRHIVDFYVAPKTGGVHTSERLQALMISLVSEPEPTHQYDFRDWNSSMQFGKLCFEEDIGIEIVRWEITLTDEELFSSSGFVDGKRLIEHTKNMRRQTRVLLFPNVQIATVALKGRNIHGIQNDELSSYRDGDHRRFINALS